MNIKKTTLEVIVNALQVCDKDHHTLTYAQISKVNNDIIITSSDGVIAFRERVYDESDLLELVEKNDKLYICCSYIKVIKDIITANKFKIHIIFDYHDLNIFSDSYIIRFKNDINYPNVADVIKNLQKTTIATVKINFKQLEKICKSLTRKDTKTQIITFQIQEDNAIMMINSTNADQVAVIVPIKQ